MHPREGLVGVGVPLALVVPHLRGTDGVPHRGVAGAEDGRRSQQHPGRALHPRQRRVDVALHHAVGRRVVGHEGRGLVDVADLRAAVVDAGGRDVDEQGYAGVDRRLGDGQGAVEADPTLVVASAAERVDRGDEGVGAGHHGRRERRVGEVADVLLDAGALRRGAHPAYDGAHPRPTLTQRGHDVAAHESVGTGHDDDRRGRRGGHVSTMTARS